MRWLIKARHRWSQNELTHMSAYGITPEMMEHAESFVDSIGLDYTPNIDELLEKWEQMNIINDFKHFVAGHTGLDKFMQQVKDEDRGKEKTTMWGQSSNDAGTQTGTSGGTGQAGFNAGTGEK